VNSSLKIAASRLIGYFMHPSLMHESDLRHRARILIITLLIFVVWVGVAGIIVPFAPLPEISRKVAAGLCAFAVTGCIVTLFVLRRKGNFQLCGMMIVGGDLACVIVAIMITGGGMASPVMQLVVFPPILAYFFGGIRWGTITGFASLLTILGFELVSAAGVQINIAAHYDWKAETQLSTTFVALFFTSTMAFIYEHTADMLKRERDQEYVSVRLLARTDPLTGLPNRLSFDDDFRSRVEACVNLPGERFFTLCYLDLNGFKPINDQYGHDVGDEVLRIIAERLCKLLRARDRVSRHGGDEFMLILDEVRDPLILQMMATRLTSSIEEPLNTSVGVLSVGGSLGFAICPDQAQDTDALMHAADSAMYESKRNGGGWRLYHAIGG